MVAEFSKRRDLIVDGLNGIPGIRCHKPSATFYVFPNVEGTGWEERDLQRALLEEAGVAALSGTAFGSWGKGYLRFSYANSQANLRKAIDRVATFLADSPRPSREAQPVAGSRA